MRFLVPQHTSFHPVYPLYSLYHFLGETHWQMLGRVEEHGGAYAILAVGAVENVGIDATLASTPKRLVVGEILECNGQITELSVHLHHGRATRQRENLGMRPTYTRQGEGDVFYFLGKPQAAIVGMHYESGGRDIMLVSPRLYITETCEILTVEGDDRFRLAHLCSHVVGRTFRYACAAHLSGIGNGLKNGVNIFNVALVGNQHFYVFHLFCLFFFFFLSFLKFIAFILEYHVLAHGINNGVVVGAVTYDDKNGIVAGYRSQNLGDVTVVNVVGYAAGVSRTRADHSQVA